MNTQSQPQSNTTVGECGPETFAGSLQTSRSSGRKLPDIIGDICDESLKNIMNKVAKAIVIITQTATTNTIRSFALSDNIVNGFEGIDREGNLNPFNATHFNPTRHSDDNEWSEHGKGLIDAFKACCAIVRILTRYKKFDGTYAYEECTFDFEAMAEENRHSPSCVTVTQEYYLENHLYETGSTITLEQLLPNIFTGTFDDIKKKIQRTLVDKYSSALMKGNEDYQEVSRLKFQVGNTQPIDIVAVPSPLENVDHPHDKYEVVMEVRQNENNIKAIFCKKSGTQTKWHAWNQENGKYGALNNNQYQRKIQTYSTHIGTYYMKGTRTSGTGYDRYPMGSLILKRLLRTLTQDIRNGGRHMSFLPTPRNGEVNYHYIEMTWNEKALTKFIEYNLQKKIDCDLTRLNSLISEAGKWAEQQIRSEIKSESRFKKDWLLNYQNIEAARWNGDLTYQQNLNNAEAALEEYNNALLSESEEESEDEQDIQTEVVHIDSDFDDDFTTTTAGGVEDDEEDDEEDVQSHQDQDEEQEGGEEGGEEDEQEIQSQDIEEDNNEDNNSIIDFDPIQNEPQHIPIAPTTHRSGLNLENANLYLDYLENLELSDEQKTEAILGVPSQNIKGTKSIWNDICRKKLGEDHFNYVCGLHFYKESTYTLNEWIIDIRKLINTSYNGTEATILGGSDISGLVLYLNPDNNNNTNSHETAAEV